MTRRSTLAGRATSIRAAARHSTVRRGPRTRRCRTGPAATADLGTVLDETRIVIEPMLKDAGIRVAWEATNSLPLVQGKALR